MNYWLHPEAREDLREAANFYRDNAGTALSQALLAEFEHSMGLLLEHPRLGGKWRHGKRRYLMRRFPFAIIYSVLSDQLRILAVAHESRRPGYWRGRK
jgi:toxin ParE1/3/4